jgi:hypothetical protein
MDHGAPTNYVTVEDERFSVLLYFEQRILV